MRICEDSQGISFQNNSLNLPQQVIQEKPSDLSWVEGRHFASYEVETGQRYLVRFKKKRVNTISFQLQFVTRIVKVYFKVVATQIFLFNPYLGKISDLTIIFFRWVGSTINQLFCCSLSHYLQGFIHPRSCRISSINSTTFYYIHLCLFFTYFVGQKGRWTHEVGENLPKVHEQF